MSIYDGNGNIVPIGGGGGGDSFYTETDLRVNMLTMPQGELSQSNPENFLTPIGSTGYYIVDYFPYSEEYISVDADYGSNRFSMRLACYDSNKTFISVQLVGTAVASYSSEENDYRIYVWQVPTNTAYVRFEYRAGTTRLNYVSRYMRNEYDYYDLTMNNGYAYEISNLLSVPNLITGYEGKKVLCLGDSITENNTKNDNKSWCEYLTDIFGMEVYNNGKSGTGLIKEYMTYPSICNRIDFGTGDYPTSLTPDIILIMANGNDCTGASEVSRYKDYSGNTVTLTNEYGQNTLPIGSSSDTSNTLSVYGAMRHLFDSLIAKYPIAKIGFITSTPRKQDLASKWGADKANFYGHGAFGDYVTAIKWVCDEYNIPCLDLYHSTIFRPWNTTNCNTFFADAEIHPNTLGTIEGIVKPVAKWIWDNF